jgi:alkylation response protein AidB-like acyl-CoA dehydrogenase
MGADGWLAIGWPKEYGGRGGSALDSLIFADEAAIAGAPVPFLTINTVGPTIMKFGTAEQKSFYLPRIAAGELHFSIGYSEPDAGTDLAALRTRAVRDGTDFVSTVRRCGPASSPTPTTCGSPAAPIRMRPGTRGCPS